MRGAQVFRLVPQPERIGREAGAAARGALMALPDHVVPVHELQRMLHALQRLVEPDSEGSIWPGGFAMLSRLQTAAVWDAIRALPGRDRPQLVRHAFDLVLLNLRQDTGEVMLTRDELAERMRCIPRRVSEVMGVLERMGVIVRERRRVPWMRGPGLAVYFVNPHVAWNGDLKGRGEAAAGVSPPLLRLMEGGGAAKPRLVEPGGELPRRRRYRVEPEARL